MTKLGNIVGVALVILACGWLASCEIGLWNECRNDHSWLYCMRVLGK